MFGGKRRKWIERVQASLKKRAAGLEPEEAERRARKIGVAMDVKHTLTKLGVADVAKRRRIHRIMQRMVNRTYLLQSLGKFRPEDQQMQSCMAELVEEFGDIKSTNKFLHKCWSSKSLKQKT